MGAVFACIPPAFWRGNRDGRGLRSAANYRLIESYSTAKYARQHSIKKNTAQA